MVADKSVLEEGLKGYHHGTLRSHDVLEYFVHSQNPFTGDFLHEVFDVPADSTKRLAYLAYINLFFVACAFGLSPSRRRLFPWLAALVCFATLRLGHYLTINGVEYHSVVLPERTLSEWMPALFGAINWHEYYQPGVILPLAVLSSFGLSALLQSKPTWLRISIVLLSIFVLAFEFYVPRFSRVLEPNKTAFIDWLKAEPDAQKKLINLPQEVHSPQYFVFIQALTDYPIAYGFSSRNPKTARSYVNANLFLRNWDESRSVHCLPHNQAAVHSRGIGPAAGRRLHPYRRARLALRRPIHRSIVLERAGIIRR